MAISRRTLAELERHLHKHAGLELPTWVVESRCASRMKELGLDAAAYVALLGKASGASELDALMEAVRVGETRFFRHGAHVEALLEVVIPSWRDRGVSSPRVWSAGCASGEEPYTLALVLSLALGPPAAPSILATDVSADAITSARRGVFPKSILEHIPEKWQSGLSVGTASVPVRPEVVRLVTFEQSNLASPNQPTGFDLIWCRNVLIYFGKAAQAQVLERLVASLNPFGFLFLGYSESLRDVPGLEPVAWADHVLYQKVSHRKAADARKTKTHEPSKRPQNLQRTGPDVLEPRTLESPSSEGSAKEPRPKNGVAHGVSRSESVLRVKDAAAGAITAAIGKALKTPGIVTLTVDFDDADFVEDDVAPLLRRALATASKEGVELRLRATRPGPKRWLRRHRFSGGDT